MSEQTIHVAMGADVGYTIPLAVALASIDEVSKSERVVIHVLHRGFTDAAQKRLVEPLGNVEINWIAVDEASLTGASFTSSLSAGSLYRLMLGEVLPAEVARVLYIDADTVVRESLADAANIDLGGHAIGAVRDAGTPWAASLHGAPWRELGMDPSAPYFNSGVLFIDLERWRSEEIGSRSLELLRTHTPRWGDQDALNAITGGRWQELPRRWNLQTSVVVGDSADWALWHDDAESALSMPVIIHFTGYEKPWDYDPVHPLARVWLETLDRTAWSGWRPPQSKPDPLERVARAAFRRVRSIRVEAHRKSTEKKLASGR